MRLTLKVILAYTLLNSNIFGSILQINHELFDISVKEKGINQTEIEYLFGQFHRTEVDIKGETYSVLKLGQEVNIQTKGFPALPKITRSIIIPDDIKMTVNVLESEFIEYNLKIAPGKGVIVRPTTPADVPFTFSDVYQQNEYYPGKLTELGDPYILRDFRGLTVTFFPFQYNPVTQSLKVYHHLVLEVIPSGPGEINIKNRTVNGYNKHFESFYASHFINHNPLMYETVDERGRMIVISYGDFFNAIQPFVDWKNQKGIQCDLYDVYELGANANGIREFIQQEYDSSDDLCFVQLVGDHAQVPTIMVSNGGGGGSDPSYSLLEGNDDYPEIFVGRFSASSLSQVETQVERSIHYERDIIEGNWLHKGIGIGSNQGPGDDGEYDNEHLDVIREKLLNYTYTEIDAVYDPSGTDQQGINAINNGLSIINYTGHGSTTAWGNGASLNINQVNGLENDWELPHVISVGCVNGAFENTTCFAEAWLRATNEDNGSPTGAVAFYASTVNQYWSQPMRAQDHTMDLLVGFDYSANQAIDQKHTIGGLWYNGSCNMMDVYGQSGIDMFLTWIIFGDASLVVRTNIPEPINVSHTGTFLIGTNTYSVSTGFSDALVALSNEGELLASGYTDASGSVILELLNPPTDPGEMTLTVTAYDRITNIQPITVISPEGPYLIVNDVTTTTNDDSIVEYGENVSITISVENMGNDPAMDIMINLESDDPFIEITNGNIFIYAIDENETLVIDDAFSAQISENVPNEQSIEIQISMMTDNNNWTSDFTITAFAPDLSVNSVSIENDDNSNGILDAGESADLQIVLENSGGSDLDPFTLNIESETPFVTIVSGTGVTEGIEEGSQTSFNFSVLVDVDTPLGYNAEFLLTGTSEIGYEYSESFVLSVGLVLEDFETGNFYLYPWEFSGDSPWIITEEPFAGTFSAKSGEIFDNQSSVLSVTLDVLENGEITFYRKVSSSPNNDYLKFDIDDSVFGQWSGNMDWSSVAYPVSEGQHTFTWTYIKDGWDSQGEDSGWIDYIIFPTVVPPQLPELYISTQSLNTSALPGESDTDSFIIENTGSEELNYTITHSASGTRDEYEFDIPDSPDQYNWSYNTLTDMGWIEYEITEPNITMNNWTLSFNWQTDWWPAEGSFWVTSPNGTTAEIASALESGTYSITLDSFAGESLPGTWTLWIEDTYGDGGHQASNITLSVESAEPENNWLTVDTYFGMIPPTESQHINVMCDAADLIEGDYYGTINIYSNDPYNSETAVEVFFTVGEIVNEVTIHIINDWNMIGIPFDYENTEVQNIFPNSVENTLFSFSETGYSSESELQLGTGYWLRFDVTESIAMTGTPVENLSISLMEGWNLISGYSFPIPVENIIDAENILVPNTLYGYSENGYSPSSVVNPGYGYWIRTSGSGEIQLSTSNRVNKTVPFDNKLKNANRIVLNGIPLFFGIPVNEEEIVYYSLPPKPPSGATDIRFSGDTKLCQSNECMIDVINNGQPLEIECELKDGKSWEILDESENVFECEGIQVLKVDSESETFVLRKSTSSHTPTEFALFPAHPNPFNPVTTIRFSVGVGTFGSNISTHTTSTSLQVYDITGKLVEILVDKQLSPGIHSVKWNATGFPSGMYFILFEGSGKRIIQKVVLMK